MKKLFFTVLFCLFATSLQAAVITAAAGGGNWNVGATWVGGVAPTSADDALLTATSGGVTITASTTVNSLNCTGYTGTLTHNAAVILTIDSQDATGNSLVLVSTMTYTLGSATTSAITFTGVGTNKITTGGKTLGNIIFNNAGDTFQLQDNLTTSGSLTNTAGIFDPQTYTVTMTGSAPTITPTSALSFYNLTRTGNAAKTDSLTLAGDITVTNTLTITGNSSINRLLVTSNTLGTPRTITVTGATFVTVSNNYDLRDITFVNGANLDLTNGGANLIGNCGGNSVTGYTLTFTTAANKYWVANTGSWSDDDTHWATVSNGSPADGNIPLPQDDVFFDGSSFTATSTVTADMPRLGKTIDWSVSTQTTTFALTSTTNTIYGGLDLTGLNTLSQSQHIYFEGRSSFNLTSAGIQFNSNAASNEYFQMFGGTIVFIDAFYAFGVTQLNNGTIDAATNNVNYTCRAFASSNSNVRAILMGTGTWTITDESIGWTIWNTATINNLNLVEGGTIVISNDSNNSSIFSGGGETFNNISITGGGTAVITFVGSNTFATFTINAPKTIKFTDLTTTTVSSFVATGTAVSAITITGTSTAGWTINDTLGENRVYYCTISYSTAGGGASWLAYTTDGNTNGGNNSGWVFTAPSAFSPLLINIF